MRHFSLFIAFFLSKVLLGQEIELVGRYGASFLGGETIDFKSNDSFYFNGFYCTYGVHGKGTCEIKNGYLYLYFQKGKTRKILDTLRKPIIATGKCSQDSCLVRLDVVANSDISIPYASIEISKARNIKRSTMTDSTGFIALYFRPQDFPLALKTSGVGLISNSIKLDSFGNYSIKLFHRLTSIIDKEFNNGEIWVYEIGDIDDQVIEMRPRNSPERFRKYKKISD